MALSRPFSAAWPSHVAGPVLSSTCPPSLWGAGRGTCGQGWAAGARRLCPGVQGATPGGRLQAANIWGGAVQASGESGLAGTWSSLPKALRGLLWALQRHLGAPPARPGAWRCPTAPTPALLLRPPPSAPLFLAESLCYVPRLLCCTPESKQDRPGVGRFLLRSEPGPLGCARGAQCPPVALHPHAFHTPVPWAAGD